MTNDRVDQLVRAADPYDPEAVRDLRGADQALLEEILETVPATKQVRWRRTMALTLATAAVLAIAVSVPALLRDPESSPAAGAGQVPEGSDPIVYTAAAVKVAESNPRLLIDEPGWTVTTVYGFAKNSGTIAFRKGDREIEMNWYAADAYDGYYADRLDVGPPEPITIDGRAGALFAYSDADVAVMLKPDGPTFVELRTDDGFTDRADALAVLGKVKRVDVDTWLAALPPEIVVPGKAEAVAKEMFADVPLPPDFDRKQLAKLGVNDRYQFAAEALQRVECGWLDEWDRADRAGDAAAGQRAVDALASARGWHVLTEMDPRGDFSEGPWQLADRVTFGDKPIKYQEMLGCVPRAQ